MLSFTENGWKGTEPQMKHYRENRKCQLGRVACQTLPFLVLSEHGKGAGEHVCCMLIWSPAAVAHTLIYICYMSAMPRVQSGAGVDNGLPSRSTAYGRHGASWLASCHFVHPARVGFRAGGAWCDNLCWWPPYNLLLHASLTTTLQWRPSSLHSASHLFDFLYSATHPKVVSVCITPHSYYTGTMNQGCVNQCTGKVS